ncbi:mannan-binding lectin serine peptidase 1 (C4 C2 activating component of Ra-reactive factor) [Chamberlinius hualienensis]
MILKLVWLMGILMGDIIIISGAPYRRVSYLAKSKQHFTDCNVTLSAINGSINSPRYPNNYQDNSDCWFNLQTLHFNNRIKLEIIELSLEHSTECSFDYLEIFDGYNSSADILGRFCDTKPMNEIESSSHQLLLHFHSDYLLNSKGFLIKFNTVINNKQKPSLTINSCPMEGSNSVGVITSPEYPYKYPSDTNCTVILQTEPNQQYVLRFDDLDIEYDELCLFDYVEIRDGSYSDSPLVGQICGKRVSNEAFTSTGNSVFIRFISDSFVEYRGFRLSYHSILDLSEYNHEDEIVEDEDEIEDEDKWVDETETEPEINQLSSMLFAQPFNYTLSKGQSQTIDCLINGSTYPVVWFKDHSFVTTDNEEDDGIQLLANNSLQIISVNEETEGIYTCVVLSEHGAFSINFWISIDDEFSSDDIDECGIDFFEKPKDTVAKDSNGCTREIDALLTLDYRTSVPDFDTKTMCGKPKLQVNKTRSGKVVAGRIAPKGSFPWQAMLWETWVGQFCGGSLISPRWIITAAHCFTEFQQQFNRQLQPDQLSIKLGKHDRSKVDPDEQNLSTDQIILHPKFNKITYDNDIALVRLVRSVSYTNTVLPICLVNSKLTKDELYEKDPVVGSVTGWGTITEHGMPSAFLREIRLPLVNFSTCANSTNYPVTKNMFCAGYHERVMGDACHGDSGGPYTVNYQGQWYLIGIVSWGEGCDREGKYGFYTKVDNYINWIISTIEEQ